MMGFMGLLSLPERRRTGAGAVGFVAEPASAVDRMDNLLGLHIQPQPSVAADPYRRPPPLPPFLLPGGKCFRMLSPAAAATCKRLIANGFCVKIFSGKELAAGLAVLGRFSATSYELRATSFQLPGSRFGRSGEEVPAFLLRSEGSGQLRA